MDEIEDESLVVDEIEDESLVVDEIEDESLAVNEIEDDFLAMDAPVVQLRCLFAINLSVICSSCNFVFDFARRLVAIDVPAF